MSVETFKWKVRSGWEEFAALILEEAVLREKLRAGDDEKVF
jgi:hypothetical protein